MFLFKGSSLLLTLMRPLLSLFLRVLRSVRQLFWVLLIEFQGLDCRDLSSDSLHVAEEADGVFHDAFDFFFALFMNPDLIDLYNY